MSVRGLCAVVRVVVVDVGVQCSVVKVRAAAAAVAAAVAVEAVFALFCSCIVATLVQPFVEACFCCWERACLRLCVSVCIVNFLCLLVSVCVRSTLVELCACIRRGSGGGPVFSRPVPPNWCA